MRLATALSFVVFSLTLCASAQTPAATTLEYYKTMDWISTSQAHTETFDVVAGQWVELKLTCYTGPYLQACGQPAYFARKTEVKVPKLASWTVNGFTEQVFGMTASATGTIRVYFPVLFGNIEYKGAVMVSAGPN